MEVVDPPRKALLELVDHALRSDAPISLLNWKRVRPELIGVSDEAWLMFSCLQLKGGGMRLSFVEQPELDPFPVNEAFYDVVVQRPLPEAA